MDRLSGEEPTARDSSSHERGYPWVILRDRSLAAEFRIGSIRDNESCQEAARLMKSGYPVGAFVRSTCAIWLDAANPRGVEAIFSIKGAGRTGKPLSLTLYADALVPMIDLNKIRPDLRSIFGDSAELASRLTMLCFLRIPVNESAARGLPQEVVSRTPDGTCWIQNCVPGKQRSDFLLVDRMLEAGIKLPSATSMNRSGQPEIVDQDEAQAFCRSHGIRLFLGDRGARPVARGSYPIISVSRRGVTLLREGHFPPYLFRYLLGTDLDTSGSVPAKFPVYPTHSERSASGMDPHQLHDEMQAILEGAALP